METGLARGSGCSMNGTKLSGREFMKRSEKDGGSTKWFLEDRGGGCVYEDGMVVCLRTTGQESSSRQAYYGLIMTRTIH